MTEPMTDEHIAEIKAIQAGHQGGQCKMRECVNTRAMLDEVERLRAENARLRERATAYRIGHFYITPGECGWKVLDIHRRRYVFNDDGGYFHPTLDDAFAAAERKGAGK